MRALLSDLITQSAVRDPSFIMISGDHGYALFDQIRHNRPAQFLNAGIAEQGMVGIAAGLARTGFRPAIYGLAAFVPIRVIEQIKLDLCFSQLPVVVLGDGAGLVYSTLGATHQCGEDIAALAAMPNLRIFSPADRAELQACYDEAMGYQGPSYIRIGKGDRPPVHQNPLTSTLPHFVHVSSNPKTCLVTTGSMVSPCLAIAKELNLACISVPQLKPFGGPIRQMLARFSMVVVVEEHSRHGGLTSMLLDSLCLEDDLPHRPRIHSLSLEDKFSQRCGTYQYALSEHGLSDEQLARRISTLLASCPSATQALDG